MRARRGDQVDVVRHEAVSRNLEPCAAALGAQEVEVHCPVVVIEEDGLPQITALGNMMPAVRRYHTSDSSHAETFGWPCRKV